MATGKTRRSVLTTIRDSTGKMSKGELLVANYLLKNPHSISLLSISTLASSAEVSETTIMRFAKKLRFKGFTDFRRAFLQDMLKPPREDTLPVYEEISLSDQPFAVIEKLFSLHQRTFDSTLTSVDQQVLAQAAKKIANARSVAFHAHGGSGYIAQSALCLFLGLGIRCSAWVDETTQESSTKLLGEEDVVVAISHSGSTETIVGTVRTARAHGVTTIVITNYADRALAKECDLPLITAVPETPIGAEAGASRVAQLAILDALAASVALLPRKKSDSRDSREW